MSSHQVVLRKGGPIHGVAYDGAQKHPYSHRTDCGLYISTLATPKRRKFDIDNPQSCRRCKNLKARQ